MDAILPLNKERIRPTSPFKNAQTHLILEVALRRLPDLLGLEVLLLDPRLLPAAALVEDPPDEPIDGLLDNNMIRLIDNRST